MATLWCASYRPDRPRRIATVSSTVGSPTMTGANRRSRAGSFSMCWRYSSSVVAPTRRSSPRASSGLIMLPASIDPSAAPAPTMVCSSSMKVTTSPSDSAMSASTAFMRSSNSPRNFAPATIAPRSRLMTRRPFNDSGTSPATTRCASPSTIAGLADTRLADEHGVVLGTSGQHLHDAADLGVAADDRVELALARPLGEVDAVLLQRLVRALRVGGWSPGGCRVRPRRFAAAVACARS